MAETAGQETQDSGETQQPDISLFYSETDNRMRIAGQSKRSVHFKLD